MYPFVEHELRMRLEGLLTQASTLTVVADIMVLADDVTSGSQLCAELSGPDRGALPEGSPTTAQALPVSVQVRAIVLQQLRARFAHR